MKILKAANVEEKIMRKSANENGMYENDSMKMKSCGFSSRSNGWLSQWLAK